MKAPNKIVWGLLLSLAILPLPSRADYYSVNDLQDIIAPLALCTDELITDVLIASAFPEQIKAARLWLDAHPNSTVEEIEQSWNTYIWDNSVRLLLFSPELLRDLDEHTSWLSELHDAYTNQQNGLSRAIQILRSRAYNDNKLSGDDDIDVYRDTNGFISITSHQANTLAIPTSLSSPIDSSENARTWQKIELTNIDSGNTTGLDRSGIYYREPNNYNNYNNYLPYPEDTVPHDIYGRPLNGTNYPVPPYGPPFWPGHPGYPGNLDNSKPLTTNLNSTNGLASPANSETIFKQNSQTTAPTGLATEANAYRAGQVRLDNNGNGGLATVANAQLAGKAHITNNGNGGLATQANVRAQAMNAASMSGTSSLATGTTSYNYLTSLRQNSIWQRSNGCWSGRRPNMPSNYYGPNTNNYTLYPTNGTATSPISPPRPPIVVKDGYPTIDENGGYPTFPGNGGYPTTRSYYYYNYQNSTINVNGAGTSSSSNVKR